jgi:hypothetical protein
MGEYNALHSTEIIKLLAETTTTVPSGNIMSSYNVIIVGGRSFACIMKTKGPTVDPWRAPRVLTTGSRQCAAKTVPVLPITSVGSIRGTKARLHAFNLCVRWLSWRCSLSVSLKDITICRSRWPRGLRRLGYWDHRFESHWGHGCLSSRLYVVLFCVGRGLCDGLISRRKESYRVSNCVWLRDLKRGGQGPIWAVAPLEEEEEINVGWAVSRTASGSEEKCPRSLPGTEPLSSS